MPYRKAGIGHASVHADGIERNRKYALHLAARARDGYLQMRRLIGSGCKLDSRDEVKNTPLIVASLAGRLRNVETLLRLGASSELHNNAGESAITSAAAWGHTRVVRALLLSGADVDEPDRDGATALMLAANAGRVAMVRLLMRNGANIDAKDRRGFSVFDHAIWSRDKHVLRLIQGAPQPQRGHRRKTGPNKRKKRR